MQRLFIQLDPSIAVSLCAHMFMFDICHIGGGGRGEGLGGGGNLPKLIYSKNQTSYSICGKSSM